MIIRCPECSTGFELPDDQVTPKGTKLKCSRCEHIFRVRTDDDGEPEVFYRSHDKEEAQPSAAGGDGSPFPHAGLDIKPKKASAFGDLDGDKDDGFGSDFEEEVTQLSNVVEERPEESDVAVAEKPKPAKRKPTKKKSASRAALAAAEPKAEEEKVSPLSGGSGSDFGDPTDHVDDSFGEDGPYFDPEKGKVEPSKGPKKSKKGPPAGAQGPPPTQSAQKAPTKAPTANAAAASSTPQSAEPPSGWDEDDLEPHKIGGGAGQKFVAFLLLLSMVLMSFGGVVAYLNDGFLDFQALDEMIEVAFADGEYEPRAEWSESDAPTTVIRQSEDPVAVEGVHAELVSIPGGDHLFVVQGMVRNNQDSRIHDVDLRAQIATPEQRSLREITAVLGEEDLSVGEFRGLRNVDDVDDLLADQADAVVGSGDVVPFTMVFTDIPQRVIDGERFTYRVEVASSAGGDSDDDE